jgi:hypothetical protein
VIFLKVYHPGAFVSYYPAWMDLGPDCSAITQQANNASVTDVLYMACHFQHNDIVGDLKAAPQCTNTKTGCFNGVGQKFGPYDDGCYGQVIREHILTHRHTRTTQAKAHLIANVNAPTLTRTRRRR